MKILFFTSPVEDYLGDALLHGLRTLHGSDCVDFPKCEHLYKNCDARISGQVRGNGFTLYSGLLDDIFVDRFHIASKVKSGYFDLIVISDIQRQFGWFAQYRPWLTGENTIILDGSDTSTPYPAAGFYWRRPYYWGIPRAHRGFLYFKREWRDTFFSPLVRLLPRSFKRHVSPHKNLRRTAFSIPAEKIVTTLPLKTKDFPTHIVDPEVAASVPGSATSYAFTSESAYYDDLRSARFGITTKRSGWDCLRHYEIAANGAVPCFRNLDSKPATAAPHGLHEGNSIHYSSAVDLMEKIRALSTSDYDRLQTGTLEWARAQTTVARAEELLTEWKSSKA